MNKTSRNIITHIKHLINQKHVVILAHYYQSPDIQDIADYVGDSLGLAQKASETSEQIILFSGVHFMAETAKILNPDKRVLVPDMEAGCSLADSCPPAEFKKFRDQYPDHIVVSYINCSAEIKALSDIICTSSNAVKIVNSFPKNQKILFVPDKNLGNYVNRITGRNMVCWNGTCEVHELIKLESIIQLKVLHPDAKLIAHPECKAVILEMADFVGSTTNLLNYTIQDKARKYIVATETGILHAMKKASPDKEFLIVPGQESCSCNDCPYMKKNTLEKIRNALVNEQPEILLARELMDRARKPIRRMLECSR